MLGRYTAEIIKLKHKEEILATKNTVCIESVFRRKSKFYFQLQLENLTTNLVYSVRVAGSSESIYTPGQMYEGDWSETHQIQLQKDCHLVKAFKVGHSRKMALNLNAGVIAGLGATVLSCFGIIIHCTMEKIFYRILLLLRS